MKQLLSAALIVLLMSACNKRNNNALTYEINSATSVAEWKGSTPDHFHVGSFKVTGSITRNGNGAIQDGNFMIPVSSIENFDLPDPVKQQLLDHLKSPDFFNIALHPNATFRITKVVSYDKKDTNAIAGANYELTGDFSMAGETHAITFPAKVYYTSDSLKAEAAFKINRTKWGMNSYSDPSQGLYILPDVDMYLKIRAARKNL